MHSGIEIKPVRVFTRDEPCTKVDIVNCFYRDGKFQSTPVVTAWGIIGKNTPKYLRREGYVTMASKGDVDYYTLTKEGTAWLLAGLRRHLELHPDDADKLDANPLAVAAKRVVRKSRIKA